MKIDNHLTPQEQELFEALKAGAVIRANEITGECEVMAHDDLPLHIRECIRVSRAVERIPRVGAVLDMSTAEAHADMEAYTTHYAECPYCIEADVDSMLIDAESRREEGNEVTAAKLEAEAAELRLRVVKIRAAEVACRSGDRR